MEPNGAPESIFAGDARARGPDGPRARNGVRLTQWAAIVSIAAKLGSTAETLRGWVRQAERNAGHRAGLTSDERQRLKELEHENRELKRTNEILRKASAFSRRRNSTAERSDDDVHRSASRDVRGRVDLRGVADRPLHLFSLEGAAARADTARTTRSETRACGPRSGACGTLTSPFMACGRSGDNSGAKASRSPAARCSG
jgi:transposase